MASSLKSINSETHGEGLDRPSAACNLRWQPGHGRQYLYTHAGFCPCCEQNVTFSSSQEWYRDHLLCSNCQSLVRERAVALALNELVPNWRALRIHESSPADRGISTKLRLQAPRYLASYFFPNKPFGEFVGNLRNEDLEKQTFFDEIFDIVVTLDVMEHLFDPAKAYQEIYRTLCKGGLYIHTFPIRKWLVDGATPRVRQTSGGKVELLVQPPEYHGSPTGESLVTFDYGYDVARQIADWAPFDVRISRFWDPHHGIIGEYTEVIVCRKPK
jgi:SAM-dependent methyltransferase